MRRAVSCTPYSMPPHLYRKQFGHDLRGRMWAREAVSLRSHRIHARLITEEAIYFIGKHGQVVAANGDAFFEQVVGVALFLFRESD